MTSIEILKCVMQHRVKNIVRACIHVNVNPLRLYSSLSIFDQLINKRLSCAEWTSNYVVKLCNGSQMNLSIFPIKMHVMAKHDK